MVTVLASLVRCDGIRGKTGTGNRFGYILRCKHHTDGLWFRGRQAVDRIFRPSLSLCDSENNEQHCNHL